MANALAGTRIRERRLTRGLRQVDLAREAGISASYLNLIEHNRRNPPRKVLAAIARILAVPLRELSDGSEPALLSDLRDAASGHGAQGPEIDRVEEFVSRFPGWSRLVAAQSRQMRDLSAAVAALTDRLNYDPHLQSTLHEMLTNITAIRSTASILATEGDIEERQRRQFIGSINAESIRLSDAAGELVAYLDRAEERPRHAATPQEAFELFMESRGHVFAELEDGNGSLEAVLADDVLADGETRARVRVRAAEYAGDAAAMPLPAFLDAARRSGFAPSRLAEAFGCSVLAVFRRLATLAREGIEAPRFGLVIINAAGEPMYRRPLPGFSLPRFTSICALWPVFQSLSIPGRPLENVLVMPDGSEFLARSIAVPVIEAGFGDVTHFAAGMLVTALNDAYAWGMIDRNRSRSPLSVGTSCRLCQRRDCAVRSEPGLVPEAGTGGA